MIGSGGLGESVTVFWQRVLKMLRVLALDSSGFPQSIPVDDSRLLYDVPTDDPEWSRPIPLGYAHEPPDVGTRSRPGLAVGVL